jgi:hypothetical protein
MNVSGRVLTLFGVLGLAGFLSGPAGGLMTDDPPQRNVPLLRRLPNYHPLPGSAIGVLVGSAGAVMATEGRSGSPNALAFSSGGGSYRWVYVPVEGKPSIGTLMIPVGEKPGTLRPFDNLSLATPETVRRFGVAGLYTLARVEVNGGLGSPATDRIVATKIEPLDGTAAYPIKVAEVVRHFEAAADELLKADGSRQQIEAGMDRAAETAGQKRAPATRRAVITPYITWESDKEHLRLEFRVEIIEGELQPGRGTVSVGPGPTRPPLSTGTPHGKVFGVEVEIDFTVDRHGKEVSHRLRAPKPFEKKLPPPQRQYIPGASRPEP